MAPRSLRFTRYIGWHFPRGFKRIEVLTRAYPPPTPQTAPYAEGNRLAADFIAAGCCIGAASMFGADCELILEVDQTPGRKLWVSINRIGRALISRLIVTPER